MFVYRAAKAIILPVAAPGSGPVVSPRDRSNPGSTSPEIREVFWAQDWYPLEI